MGEILKARCISDAQIQFVSLVDKAANKKSFLIAKAEDGQASFSAYGKIVKTDTDSHYVRIQDVQLKKADECAYQMQIDWISRRTYTPDEGELVQSFYMNGGKL